MQNNNINQKHDEVLKNLIPQTEAKIDLEEEKIEENFTDAENYYKSKFKRSKKIQKKVDDRINKFLNKKTNLKNFEEKLKNNNLEKETEKLIKNSTEDEKEKEVKEKRRNRLNSFNGLNSLEDINSIENKDLEENNDEKFLEILMKISDLKCSNFSLFSFEKNYLNKIKEYLEKLKEEKFCLKTYEVKLKINELTDSQKSEDEILPISSNQEKLKKFEFLKKEEEILNAILAVLNPEILKNEAEVLSLLKSLDGLSNLYLNATRK